MTLREALFVSFVFFFNDTATTEIYTLSLHDALPIGCRRSGGPASPARRRRRPACTAPDRQSTRLNSSHQIISYAVFCLKKQNNTTARGLQETNKSRNHRTTPDSKMV